MNDQNDKTLAVVIMRAWRDDDFKSRLIADPIGTLTEAGIERPPGTTIKVLENTNDLMHLVIPNRPEGELSTDELEALAGGYEKVLRAQLPN